jgi:hypothetical protein
MTSHQFYLSRGLERFKKKSTAFHHHIYIKTGVKWRQNFLCYYLIQLTYSAQHCQYVGHKNVIYEGPLPCSWFATSQNLVCPSAILLDNY